MSQLVIRGHNGAVFRLNVTQFRSPMSASISSVQTRTMMHHFPIRAGQPDIQFTVHFASVNDKHKFQDFVRDHQRNTHRSAVFSEGNSGGAVILNWPERDIVNWSGYIVSMPVSEPRFEYAPKVTFGVALMESLMSKRTFVSSYGNDWTSIPGQLIPDWNFGDPEANFRLPTPPAEEQPDPGAEERGLVGNILSVIGSLFR